MVALLAEVAASGGSFLAKMIERIVSFEIGPNPPKRLDKALARDVPEDASLSRSRLVKLLEMIVLTVSSVIVKLVESSGTIPSRR